MKKKIILSLVAVAALALGVVGMSAFEAHVINVTATIENALSVIPKDIMFGTVFPQEQLTRNLDISLSQSFLAEPRVDDVSYVIKEKPKVIGDPYALILINDVDVPAHQYCLENYPTAPYDPSVDPWKTYLTHCYVSLCPMLSLTGDEPNGDGKTDEHLGYLSKKAQDVSDEWFVNLTVPGFEGMVDQAYTEQGFGNLLDPKLEHATFGCDLWVEVTGVSRNYIDKVDFGDPVSEGWHLDMIADDWSYIGDSTHDGGTYLKLGNYGGYDGGSADFRGLMGAPTGCQGEDPSNAAATFKIDKGVGAGEKKLVLRHLDGSQKDSFDVYINGIMVGHWAWQDSNENWVTTEWPIPDGLGSIIEVRLVATDPDTPWCNQGWGQVMFNWAETQDGLENPISGQTLVPQP